jgi:hypothetical protein
MSMSYHINIPREDHHNLICMQFHLQSTLPIEPLVITIQQWLTWDRHSTTASQPTAATGEVLPP